MVELILEREPTANRATLGRLLIDGSLFCLTLEDEVRDFKKDGSGKVYGETAIPAGRYKVIIDFSQRFQKNMLHVLDVPWFTGIRIHSGNKAEDTLGCILVGHTSDGATIHGGSVEMPKLFARVEAALSAAEECWLTVRNYAAPAALPQPSEPAVQADITIGGSSEPSN